MCCAVPKQCIDFDFHIISIILLTVAKKQKTTKQVQTSPHQTKPTHFFTDEHLEMETNEKNLILTKIMLQI